MMARATGFGKAVLAAVVLAAGCRPQPVAVTLPEDGSKDYHFVVLTGTAGMRVSPDERLEPVVRKINAAMPDFVVVLGDVLNPAYTGGADFQATLEATAKAYGALHVPRFFVPGADEIGTPARRAAWQKRFGPVWRSWTYKNNRFVALCADQTEHGRLFSDEQVAFLKEQVGLLGPQDRLYVFVDEPLWEARSKDGLNEWNRRIHPVLARAFDATVIAGHWDQAINYPRRDGVRYLVAGGGGLEAGLLRSRPFLGPLMQYGSRPMVPVRQAMELPAVANIVVDGRAGDWANQGLPIDRLEALGGAAVEASDCQVHLKVGWEARGLVVLAEVLDDVVLVERTRADAKVPYTQRDAVRLIASSDRSGAAVHSLIVAPSMLSDGAAVEQQALAGERGWQTVMGEGRGGCRLARNGYVVEGLLPWKSLGLAGGQAGASISMQIVVYDADGSGSPTVLAWRGGGSARRGEQGAAAVRQRVRLAASAGQAGRLVVDGAVLPYGRVRVRLSGPADRSGEPVVVLHGLNVVGRGIMLGKGAEARCTLIFCRPVVKSPGDDTLEVYLGDKRVGTLSAETMKSASRR